MDNPKPHKFTTYLFILINYSYGYIIKSDFNTQRNKNSDRKGYVFSHKINLKTDKCHFFIFAQIKIHDKIP